ncbi:MAG: hypothetical protein DRN14_06500 [Thermoplasmata archaeon]|nr:MAG: hypothetical protein DRN14_06500 [Thermoplasmata archaeon]
MYVIDDKVFLHMVKSAGISVHVGAIKGNKKIDFNFRHGNIDMLPERYRELPRYAVIRSPEDWYKSFYRFFLGVQGYLSFMLYDPDSKGMLQEIDIDEFVRRSINLKDTLLKYPNKARVFNNLLRSQGNAHFVCGYFKESFNVNSPETLDQFDMSLYEWFFKNAGLDTATLIPMDRLDIVEDLFDISIGHDNKTNIKKRRVRISPEVIGLIRDTHTEYYDTIEEFDESILYKIKDEL